MCAITRSGHVGDECERVERCLYVNLLRRVVAWMGEEWKGWEDDIMTCCLVWIEVMLIQSFIYRRQTRDGRVLN